MPSGTVKERDTAPIELLPEGWFLAKLLEVTEKPVGDSAKLKWKWQIVAPAEFAETATGRPRWAFGECWTDLDQTDKCVWRRWHEALVERPVNLDESIDTEDVKGFMAYIRIAHRTYTDKQGVVQWVAEVAQQSYEKDGVVKFAPDPDSVQPATFVPPPEMQPTTMTQVDTTNAWATPAPADEPPF